MTTFHRLALLSLLPSATALAQPGADTSVTTGAPAPISNAVEIAVGGGYMQGVGRVGDSTSNVEDLSRSGGGANLEVGYRLTPNLTLGAYGTLSGYQTGERVAPSTDLVIAATAGLKADWHFRPASAIDPWVGLGTGWRELWLGNDAGTDQELRGIDLARVQAGLDYRLTSGVALTPYVGATATMFLAKEDAMTSGFDQIDNRKVNFSFTGGLMARFDMFGSRGR